MDPKSKSKTTKQTVKPKGGKKSSNKPEADGSFPSDDEIYKPWVEPERSYHSEESRTVDYGNEPAESKDEVDSAKRDVVTYSDDDEDEDGNAKSKSKSSAAKSKSVSTSSKSAKSKSVGRSSSRFSSK